MSTAASPPQKKKSNAPRPPRRGQIKAQIFGSLYKTVVSMANRALGRNGGGASNGSASASASASAYNSDATSEVS